MGQEIVSDAENIEMTIDEPLPDLFIEDDLIYKKRKEKFLQEENTSSILEDVAKEESERKAEEFKWPVYDYSWQDFVPATFSAQFGQSCSEVPSLLSIVSDVSETVPNGALWFNFVFDWWFAEPLEPIDGPSDPTINLNFPCAKCDKKFQQDWEVTKHYIDVHLTGQTSKKQEVKEVKKASPEKETINKPSPVKEILKTPSPVKEIIQKPEPEEESEIYVEPYELLTDWRWQDFLPDWCETFLPSAFLDDYSNWDIEDDNPDPPPPPLLRKDPTPQPSPQRIRKFVLVPPTPVLKQTKYHCRTCDLTICNSCFTKKCGAHIVDFKGSATFACNLC